MSKFGTLKIFASVIMLAASITPAMADHDDDDRRWNNGNGNGNHRGWHKQKYKQQMRRAARNNNNNFPSDWNSQRSFYSRNWSHRNNSYSAAQRRALEQQMRTQYSSFNPNYHGSYNWNTYNNPQFLDYMHNNNPSTFTQVRSYLGF